MQKSVEAINRGLSTVRILKDKAIMGTAEAKGVDKNELFARLRASRVAKLALGPSLDAHVADLGVATDEFARKQDKA